MYCITTAPPTTADRRAVVLSLRCFLSCTNFCSALVLLAELRPIAHLGQAQIIDRYLLISLEWQDVTNTSIVVCSFENLATVAMWLETTAAEQALKQVHPDMGIFNKAMAIHNSSVNDILSSPSWHRYLQQGYLQQFHQWHLKQVHPDTGISNKAMAIHNSSVNDTYLKQVHLVMSKGWPMGISYLFCI